MGRLALAAALAASAGGAAQAQTTASKPPIIARAEQCLRSKVDRVVADEPDIAAAANFLVGYACAEEVAGATRYLRNDAYVQLFAAIGKMTDGASAASKAPSPGAGSGAAAAAMSASAMLSQLKVDPETGDIRMPGAGAQAGQVNGMIGQFSNLFAQFMPDTIPVPIRKLAGDLVLEARERRKAK